MLSTVLTNEYDANANANPQKWKLSVFEECLFEIFCEITSREYILADSNHLKPLCFRYF